MAVWMTKEECRKPMRVGELIMGSEAMLSTLRVVQVYRDGKILTSGDLYIPGEELLVTLVGPDDNPEVQFVFEATNAVFIGGGCDGHRVANSKAAKLLLPSDTSPNAPKVQIIAGWATGYSTVQITPNFALSPHKAIPLRESTPQKRHVDIESEPNRLVRNADTGRTPAEVVPEDPPLAPIGVASELDLLRQPNDVKPVPVKTYLRKQPEGLELPQTLPADHKVKIKPKSPNAFARAHPHVALNSKLPAEVNDNFVRQTDNRAGRTDGETNTDRNELTPTKDAIQPRFKGEEDSKIEDVMESMDKFTEQVQHHAQQRAAVAPKVPLKSPSKRTKFVDSWHSKTQRKDKKPVKLEVGDVKITSETRNDAEEEKSAENEDLSGGELSATEKRLRRSKGKLILIIVSQRVAANDH